MAEGTPVGHSGRILDHVEGYRLAPDQVKDQYGELQMLDCLWVGLESLYERVKALEQSKSFEATPFGPMFNTDGTPRVSGGVPIALVLCFFHWYAVTVCSYVRTIGRIAASSGCTKLKPNEYVEQVIPVVKYWRDKVAAHLAVSDPRPGDVGAMEYLCVVPHLRSRGGSIGISELDVTVTTRDGHTSRATVGPWALTQTHEALRKRYRPPRENHDAAGHPTER